jgi:hypothetical protein
MLKLCDSHSKYKFVAMCILYGLYTQTSVSVSVNRRDLVQMNCVKCVVSQCSVLHSMTCAAVLKDVL